jgi:hypothetical protein
MEKDGGRDEEDSKPSPATSSALIGSDPGQVVVQEEESIRGEIPSGWKVHFPFEVSWKYFKHSASVMSSDLNSTTAAAIRHPTLTRI